MSSSHHFMITSLEQTKKNYRNLLTIYSTYFPISQIVSGKGSIYYTSNERHYFSLSTDVCTFGNRSEFEDLLTTNIVCELYLGLILSMRPNGVSLFFYF